MVITATALGYCGWHSHRERWRRGNLWTLTPATFSSRNRTNQIYSIYKTQGGRGGRTCIQAYHLGCEVSRRPSRVGACVCDKLDGGCNERGGVRETKGGLGKHKLKALNVTAHSIALRHRSLLPILFAAFYNINNLENIAANCSEVSLKKKYIGLFFEQVCRNRGRSRFESFCRWFSLFSIMQTDTKTTYGHETCHRNAEKSLTLNKSHVKGASITPEQHPTLTGRHLHNACFQGTSSLQGGCVCSVASSRGDEGGAGRCKRDRCCDGQVRGKTVHQRNERFLHCSTAPYTCWQHAGNTDLVICSSNGKIWLRRKVCFFISIYF